MRRAAIILLALLLLATPTIAVAPPALAQEKTVMRILQPCEPPPTMKSFNAFFSSLPSYLILEPLFYYSRGENKFYPWLAESMTQEPAGDYIKVIVKLRKGVKWSDGKELTAKDVLTTYWIWGWIRKWWPIWKYTPKIEATDDYTVIFYLKKTAPPWALGRWIFSRAIVSYAQYGKFAPGLKVPGSIPLKGVDTDKLLKELKEYKPDKYIGTGPYVYKSYTDTEWVYEKRDHYWVKDLGVTWTLKVGKYEYKFGGGAQFDEIHWYRRISDPASWPLIMAGKFDYTWTGLSQTCYETVAKKPGYWAPTGPWLHGHALYFNCEKFPLKVRQAIAYAIDRVEYCKIAVEWGPESVTRAEWPVCISPSDVYNWLSKDWLAKWIDKYEYNPDKAEKLLKEAGYTKKDGLWYTPDGKRFSVTIHVPAGWSGWVPGAENVATQLKRFGIDAKVIELDWGMWGKTIREKGAFDLAIDFWTYGVYYPWDSYHRFYYSYTVGVGGLHFDPIVEVPAGVSKYSGKVNATELAEKLGQTLPKEEAVELTKALAYITNHYLPVLQLHEKKWANTFNIERVDCALGWSVLMAAKEFQIEMGNNPGFVYGFMIGSGLLKPSKAAAAPTPVVSYLTAYAKTDVPAFTGADGKTYGPYKAGEVMVIPKDDAERLVREGRATFTPPAPEILKTISDTASSILSTTKGTSEAVSRLFETVNKLSSVVSKVSDLTKITSDTAKETSKAVSSLSEAVSSLSDSVKDLKATISGMTSLVYASIGVSIITLILVLVTLAVALKKRS